MKSTTKTDPYKTEAYKLLRERAEDRFRHVIRIAGDHCAREGRVLAGKAIAEYDAAIAACEAVLA